jgi:hypothetical protein
MKKLLIYICLILPVVAFQSCKKEISPGDNYDFSNSLPPYAAFSSTANVNVALAANRITPGSAAIEFVLRTALQKDVTITYSVSGALTLTNQTVVIPRNTTSTTIPPVAPSTTPTPHRITVPVNTPPGTAVVTLVSAKAADGTALTIGANNVASAQKKNIVITQL